MHFDLCEVEFDFSFSLFLINSVAEKEITLRLMDCWTPLSWAHCPPSWAHCFVDFFFIVEKCDLRQVKSPLGESVFGLIQSEEKLRIGILVTIE